jgi:hypothetical protein
MHKSQNSSCANVSLEESDGDGTPGGDRTF